jgi:hypothetical protein
MLRFTVVRRRRRTPPLWFKWATFVATLCDAATGNKVPDAMTHRKARIKLKGKVGTCAYQKAVVEKPGKYYLDVKWEALIESWRIESVRLR